MRHAIEQGSQDARVSGVEVLPELFFGYALFVGDVFQGQEDRSVGEIRPPDDIFNAVENNRPHRIEQRLVLVGVKLSRRKSAAGRKSAQRVRNPVGHFRDVVEN